jgi:hypothetical protein
VGTETVIATVAEYCGGSTAKFPVRRRGGESRNVAAWLTRRLTTATLRELARLFGLSYPGSVSNLLRRAERAVAESSRLRQRRGTRPEHPVVAAAEDGFGYRDQGDRRAVEVAVGQVAVTVEDQRQMVARVASLPTLAVMNVLPERLEEWCASCGNWPL